MDSLDVEYYEVNHGKKLVAFVDVFSMHYPAQFPETWRSCETTQYDMISSFIRVACLQYLNSNLAGNHNFRRLQASIDEARWISGEFQR